MFFYVKSLLYLLTLSIILSIVVNKQLTVIMTKNSFSTRLREARLMMGFSMDKLVERTHGAITKQSISRYEKGIMRPKSDALKAISNALNISEEYLEGT